MTNRWVTETRPLPRIPNPEGPEPNQITRWVPELADDQQATTDALAAAHEAVTRWHAALPTSTHPGTPCSADWTDADTPKALAALIADEPHRYAVANFACREAAALVTDWNTHARSRITERTRDALAAEEATHRTNLDTLAVDVIATAPDSLVEQKALIALHEAIPGWQQAWRLLRWANGGTYQQTPPHAPSRLVGQALHPIGRRIEVRA